MTDAPPPSDTPETPAVKARKKRTRLQALAFFGGMGLAILAALLLVTAIGGRMYLLSDSGRGLVTSFVAGKKLGRYGRINVEGVRGDLFDDFTIDRVTVTDADGIWLEARKVRVDWDWWPLIARRFHATNVEAEVIRLIRRPLVEPATEPPGPQPLSVDIDRFSADVELLEGFSKEYGRWKLAGEALVPRKGLKRVTVNADSNSRPGDFLRLTGALGEDIADVRLNLRAQESRGGPIAGALGYSPDQPFLATAIVNGEVVDAVVRTGDFTPLMIKGRYGPQQARIAGYVDFSGSDLLDPFVRRIGRTARFALATAPDRNEDGLQGVGWRLMADNLNSSASGLIRIKDRSVPQGVRIKVSTPSLTRLAGRPLGDGAAWSARFRGDATRWSLQGSIDVLGAELSSYRARRIRGPLNIQARAGRYDIDGDLSAAGGSTAGIVGGLLGQGPRVRFEAARLVDGSYLLERLEATGQALKVTGTGGRNLLGGLGFRGRAEITDASRLRPGADGAFGGTIAASMRRSGAPWQATFDGRGRGFRLGVGELDRLLGPTPRLQLTGALTGARVAIESARLSGAHGNAAARGFIEGDGRLTLAMNWNARGPFGVGPVEIDGAMTGSGTVGGTLARPSADLRAAFGRVAAGALVLTDATMDLSFRRGADESDGRISVIAGSNYGPARASGNFYLGGQRIRLTDVDLDAGGITAQGAVALSNRFPSSADLTFTARPGAFLASGTADGRIRLTEGAGAETAILDVTGRNVRLTGSSWVIRSLNLEGRGTLDRLPFTLKADVGGRTPVSFDGTGVYSRRDSAQTVVLEGAGRVREIAFATRNPAVVALSGDGRVVRVDLGVGGGVLTGELRQDSRAAVIEANLTSVELGSLAPDLRGRATGRLSLRGSGADLSGSANVTLDDVRSVDAPTGLAIDGTLNALLVDNALRVQARVADEGNVRATADVTLPVEASAAPLRLAVVRTRPMSGEIDIQGQVQPVWDLFLGGERSLSGIVNARASLAGTIAAPRINGRMDLWEGGFRDNATGLQLRDVTLASRFDDTTALVESFSATDGSGGTVSGDGRIGLREGSGSSVELALTRFRIIDNDIAEARASGPLSVVRAADGKIQLTGRIDIDEARIEANPPGSRGIVQMDVVEINKPGGDIPEEEQNRPRGLQIGVDIAIRSPGGDVLVVGRGLNVEMNVNARVTGTINQPTLTGTARVVRGDYDFAGKRFVFDDRGTVTLSTQPEQIRLNLTATRDDPALTATIRATGTAARPEITLTSTPALPQDEILSQVLFGRSASQLSAFEAAQLAASVGALAGGGGFDVIGNLRELAGLDRLSFGGEASSLTVAGGRYITDDIYLEVIGGGENGAAVNVEWQVRRNLTVSSKFGGQGDASLSIRWRRQAPQPGTGREDRRPNR
ncbi:translocation/assembly module TamB domain-containing protein [Brevundimonas sp.]|uniref:translocation/assembly module TamB domain-containing protein n=1 Tax=Brevundimonas sp. TaxID=1871086 RepID=UPI002D3B9AEE|nr:translocation/assembly module TamB domain-containing protein [Brevundimonas sp.]HYD27424.1 translocation/assembly module TamB domain-containing protein [Brevundimonas sp.]